MALAAVHDLPQNAARLRWVFANATPVEAELLGRSIGVSPLVAQCLINRGWKSPEEAQNFLAPRLKNLADPFELPDMDKAVDRLVRAKELKEPVVIFGDYDVDGVTSAALLAENLRALGWSVECFIPNRLDEGYGLTLGAIDNCLGQHKAGLLMAVDCGSTSASLIADLQGRGIDVIVIDHHQVGTPKPEPVAFVNPHLDPSGGFHELCSVGLAFKVCHAVVKRGRQLGWPAALAHDIRASLDLVALGTIADLVPLTHENRILVSIGLERLNSSERIGLRALIEVSETRKPIGAVQVGFQLAPRLNAAGRLETAQNALELMLSADRNRARALAVELDGQNRQRQEIERSIADHVIAELRQRFDPTRDFAIIEGADQWHVGVIGIVASRVLREFYRPTIIMGGSSSEWRGSGRSIQGFNLAEGLGHCSDLLLRHGGHAMAAGLSIDPANLEPFRTRLNQWAREQIDADALQPRLRLDGETTLAPLDVNLGIALERLDPCGQGNPPVRLAARNLRLDGLPRKMGREQNHARFRVTDGRYSAEAVWWSCGNAPMPSGTFDLAFEPHLHEYQGIRSLQLKVLDWRPSS